MTSCDVLSRGRAGESWDGFRARVAHPLKPRRSPLNTYLLPQHPPLPMCHNSVLCYLHVTDWGDGSTLCPPLEDQHQQSLVAPYSPYDDCLGHYEHHARPPALPFVPYSSSSELSHALMETPPPESQPINHGSITLQHESSGTLAELNTVKTGYESAVNGFSLLTSPGYPQPLAKVCTPPASLPLSLVLTSWVTAAPSIPCYTKLACLFS